MKDVTCLIPIVKYYNLSFFLHLLLEGFQFQRIAANTSIGCNNKHVLRLLERLGCCDGLTDMRTCE